MKGELVLSKNIETGEIAYKKVELVYRKSANKFIHLKVDGEIIKTTESHLFFTDSGWWKAAENISEGESILTSEGIFKKVEATEVKILEEYEGIYNLNVEDYHTYFVGTQGLLVHNDCSEKMTAASREAIEKAKAKGITDPDELSKIGEKAANEVSDGVIKVADKVKPSKMPDANAVPEGRKTKIGKNVDDAERRSLTRENDSADILAKEGYSIEQNPAAPEVAPKKPDYRIEGQLFDCFAPAEQTPIKNILSTLNEKVNIKKQANRMVVNLQDWDGSIDDLARELVKNPVKNLEEVIAITKEGKTISIFP